MFEYVRDAGLRFEGARTKRKKTVGIVLHHLAGEGSVEDEHRYSLSLGWIGIGYNFYIRMDGTVWEGRGLEYVGAHAGRKVKRSTSEWNKGANNNSQTVGIGLEGYYHPGSSLTRKEMPKAQYDACVRLMRDLRLKYPSIKWIKGHKEMPATATACPGDYFPLKELVQDGMGKASGSKPSTPKVTISRLLKLTSPNMRGADVRGVQGLLRATGAKIEVDGIFGPNTERAVKRYQNAKGGLAVDGIVGRDTITALGGAWKG